MIKTNFYQLLALAWLLGTSFSFAPVLHLSTKPDVGSGIAQGIVATTVLILAIPYLMKWRLFRKMFCWTDALSENQRAALAQNDLRKYYQLSVDENYSAKARPYFNRIVICFTVLFVLGVVLPNQVAGIELNMILMLVNLQVFLVTLVMFLSMPLFRRQPQ